MKKNKIVIPAFIVVLLLLIFIVTEVILVEKNYYSYKDFSIGQKDFNSKELYTSNYPGTFPTLPGRGYFRRGDKGLQVILVQKYLNWFGNYKLKLDGSYGPKTIAAVKNFQKKMKIKQDGLFGEGSLSKALYYRK